MVDAFVGKFVVEKRENFDGFMKGIGEFYSRLFSRQHHRRYLNCPSTGVPEEYVEKARNAEVKTEISKNGDVISVTRIRPMKTTTNSFSFGKESEVENIKGEKMKVGYVGDGVRWGVDGVVYMCMLHVWGLS